MKIKFAQIRGDEILHLSYNQRAEEIERLNKHVDDQAATIVQLREALENVYNVGMQGIGYVGAANYPERERKAFDDLQKAMDAARALKGGE